MEDRSVFDLFRFDPVAGDPFQGQGAVSPVVSEYQKTQPDPNADILAKAASIPTDKVPPMQENWAQYAGDPTHPLVGRITSAAVEEARRFGMGIKNDLQTFMGPMYGQGHVPMANEGQSGADYAGAGLHLASLLQGPGGESGVGAGWNAGASKFLQGLTKQKPPLLPETASVVQKMIANGPLWGQRFFEKTPDGTPGKGYAQIATTKHLMEEAAKPKPPPVVTPSAAQAATASQAPVVTVAQPGTGLPVPAGSPASVKGPPPLKKPKTVKSTPLTPQQALFGGPSAITQEQVNKLFSPQVPVLRVPTMKPYDPTLTGKAALSHETAPGTSGQTLPFNPGGVPMDQASKLKRMQDLGYGPLDNNILWWRGVAPHGPYSWDSAGVGYRDPITKDYEPGLFLHPDVNAYGKPGAPNAQLYGANLNPHVLKTQNPLVAEWKKIAKTSSYSQAVMSKVVKDAWKKGHDALLLKNISDIGGNHDQLIVRYPHQLRHPHAAFDPAYKDSPNLLAAGGTGGVAPMLLQDKDLEEGGDDGRE